MHSFFLSLLYTKHFFNVAGYCFISNIADIYEYTNWTILTQCWIQDCSSLCSLRDTEDLGRGLIVYVSDNVVQQSRRSFCLWWKKNSNKDPGYRKGAERFLIIHTLQVYLYSFFFLLITSQLPTNLIRHPV